MTERTIRGGSFRETFTNTNVPKQDNSKHPHPRVTSGSHRTFVKFDISGIRKQTLVSAYLRGRVKGSWAAQTLTATPVAERMTMREVNADNLPTLRTGQAVSGAQPSRTDGQYVEINVTAFIQSIADGAENYGLQITTGSGAENRFYGTESKHKNDTWQLVYEIAEKPDPPTDLTPNGGVIAKAKPVVASAFRDPGGESKVLAAIQVQVGEMSADTFVSSWDSGIESTDKPRLNLANTSYPGAAEGSTPKWRMKHMDGAGFWSNWSDVAEWTYDLLPTITLTNPVAGFVYDPSPTFSWAVSDGVMKAWRLRVAKGSDRTKILYDSRKRQGNDATSMSHEMPFRDKETRKRILRDDETYWLNIRVWDRLDRETTSGAPIYAELWVQFTLDDDVAQLPPESLTVVQIGNSPRVRLMWDLPGGYAEGYVIRRDGRIVERLDPDEITVDGTVYSWVDNGARPFRQNVYTVQAIYDGKQTIRSPKSTITPEVEGVWLLGADVEACLDGIEVSGFTATDKRATHELLNQPYDIDIIYALRGMGGSYTGTFGGADWEDTHAALMAMRQAPEAQLQLVYGPVSVPVLASISQPLPTGDMLPGIDMQHAVSFTVQQADDFEAI